MKLIRTQLGKNLDAPVAEFVILRRERILVDADFANRGFRRKLPAGKTVNVNLTAIGPGRGSGERLQFRCSSSGSSERASRSLPLMMMELALFSGVTSTVGAFSSTVTFSWRTSIRAVCQALAPAGQRW